MTNKAILIGGGQFGRELLSWAEAARRAGNGPELVGYCDDAGPVMDGFSGISLPYLGKISDELVKEAALVLAVGEPSSKKDLANRFGAGTHFLNVIHPSAVVTDNAVIGNGVVIGPHCYVANHAEIGSLTSINSFCGIGHDVRLGDYCTVSSGVDLMGAVVVEEGGFIGSGARILPGVRVASGARIGAGSIVMRNVKPGQSLYAPPAKTL